MPPTKKTRFFGEFLHFPFLFLREIYHMPFFFSKILTLPLQNSLFREEWDKKRAKIFQLKFSWIFPAILREGSPSLNDSSCQFSPKVAAHPPRPAAESGSRWIPKTIDSWWKTPPTTRVAFFFRHRLLNGLEQICQHFVKTRKHSTFTYIPLLLPFDMHFLNM